MFGAVMGTWKAAPNLRNGKMVLIYAAQEKVFSLLTPEEMTLVTEFLGSNTFNPKKQKNVLEILRASDMVIKKLSKLHQVPTKSSSKTSGTRPKPKGR